MSEAELAIHFINYFQSNNYDVFQEVEVCGGRIDIVATDGNIIIGCEVKTTASLKVVEQALNNRRYCHYSYIAVPFGAGSGFFNKVCEKFNIGKLEYNDKWKWNNDVGKVFETVKPIINRKITHKIKLAEYMKESVAGTSDFQTPFKQTIKSIVNYVTKYPNSKFNDVMENVPHHYRTISTARSSIGQWIKRGVIKEFIIENGIIILKKDNL
jgi:hypothetical protein